MIRDIQSTIRKFFPAMSLHETMLHILYAKQKQEGNGIIEPDSNMRRDYMGTIDELIKMGLITRIENGLKFTETGLKKINYLRDIRGLSAE